MFHIFHFLQCDLVLGIVNPLPWVFNAISNDKSCLISMPLLSTYIGVRTVKFFPPVESWLVNSNFSRASRIQGIGVVQGLYPRISRNRGEGCMERINQPTELIQILCKVKILTMSKPWISQLANTRLVNSYFTEQIRWATLSSVSFITIN